MQWKSKGRRLGVSIIGVGILAILAAGSAPTYQSLTNYTRKPIQYGELVNKDLRIESVGGAWTSKWSVNGGEQFRTPFSVYWWQDQGPSLNDSIITSKYQDAYEKGARAVMVHVEGRDQPLYGLIAFNDAVGAAFGPATQSYYVKIADDKIAQAYAGNITVSYEKMTYKGEWRNDSGYNSKDYKWYSWVLWLSKTPLVNTGGRSLGP